jgi:hypothetical protein
MLFNLHVTAGIDIRDFSDFPQEDEVLLMPGAVFEVTLVVPPGMLGGAAMVNMRQLEEGAPVPAAPLSEALLALNRGGAAALTSLHDHPVRNVTGSREWTCDVCGKACEMGNDQRYRCGECADFDACADCYKQAHIVDGVNHRLKLVTVSGDGGWFCNECRQWGRPMAAGADAVEPLRRFRCYMCDDFDLCGNCVRANAAQVL